MAIVSPSILSADFGKLGADCRMVLDAGAQMLHYDVMDGHFVPNISFGVPVLKSLHKGMPAAFYDVHLMISHPLQYAEPFIKAGASLYNFHLECEDDIQQTIDAVKALGCKVGLTIKPGTDPQALAPYLDQLDLVLVMSVEPGFGGQKFMPSALDKLRWLKAERAARGAHYLLNIRPSGDWPAQYFYYAGGVPRVMEEIKSMLHLDVMTVTGKTLGENLEELKKNGFYQHCDAILAEKTAGFARPVSREDIIHSFDNAKGTDGSIAILKGNLAPEGSVIKHTACPKNMFEATLRAKPYDSEEACISAVLHGEVKPGDAIFIRYEGPRGSGMPEMFYTGEAICADPKLASSVALITDGRFSGTNNGCFVGHISPEAAEGGPIAIVHDGDLVEIDVDSKKLELLVPQEEIEARLKQWKRPEPKFKKGWLGLYCKLAASGSEGGVMKFDHL